MIKFLTLLIPILSFYYICVEAQNSAGNLPFSTTECGQTKGCMFHPDNCIPFVNCVHATSYSLNGNQVVFELLTMLRSPTNQWVGIGFNNAPQMDGSTVTACASFNGGPYSTALSYNPAMYNLNAPIDQNTQNMIAQTISTMVVNNTLYCKMAQQIIPPSNIQSTYVQPLNQPLYILWGASGPTQTGQNPCLLQHYHTPGISSQKVNMLQTAIVVGSA